MLRDPKREAEIEFQIKVAKEPWRKFLLDAIELLRTKGWCRINLEDAEGRHCAYGALGAVMSNDNFGSYTVAYHKLRAFVYKEFGANAISVWNDGCQTVDEVTQVMDACARS